MRPIDDWTPPRSWVRITSVDAHTGGEPLRVFTGGMPELPGDTILDRRRHLMEHYDHLRTSTMWEPRGHREMYGCILTSPVSEGADLGVLFLHNEGYSTMCGHGIIGVVTVALETGMLEVSEPETTLRIDTPAGLVTASARIEENRVRSVRFLNVPSFVVALDEVVRVPGLGSVRYDLAFGGAFYAFVYADEVGLACAPQEHARIVEAGMAIKHAVAAAREMEHPFEADLNFLYGTIFIAPPTTAVADSRNVCVFADGQVDRSPTGTGVSARAAIHHARGELEVGQPLVVESIVESLFTVRVAEKTAFGPYEAVVPEVEGSAHITGRNELLIDPEDPLKHGFFL